MTAALGHPAQDEADTPQRILVIAILRNCQACTYVFQSGLAIVNVPAASNQPEAIQGWHLLAPTLLATGTQTRQAD